MDDAALLAEMDQLKAELEAERQQRQQVAEELRRVKAQKQAAQKAYEEEEEFITNRLLNRLDELKADRAALAKQVEAEEDFLVNTLQRRLSQVHREKAAVEARLAGEQDSAALLQRRLGELAEERHRLVKEKADLENALEAEQEYISLKLTKQVEKLASEKSGLAREKCELQRHVEELSGAVARTRQEKVDLEAALEAEEEAVVNRLQRQLQQVTTAYRALETRMEAYGMSPRENAPPIDATTEWIYSGTHRAYGRSPSRSSDRMLIDGRRERSLSVSSTSSLRRASADLQHGGGMGSGGIGTQQTSAGPMASCGPTPHQSASSSPSHRARAVVTAAAAATTAAAATNCVQ